MFSSMVAEMPRDIFRMPLVAANSCTILNQGFVATVHSYHTMGRLDPMVETR